MKPPCRAAPAPPIIHWPAILMMLALLGPSIGTASAAGGASCNLSATPLMFGKYVPSASSPTDFTATISVICTASGPTPVAIRGTIGLNGTGGPSGRQLSDGAHHLRYQLYLDPARTVLWSDGSGGGIASISGVVGFAAPLRQALTVYGRLLARQPDAGVGNHADQITVVLNY